METLPDLWIIICAFLAAGLVKGTAGVGLPMTALGILTFFTDPRTAFALVFVSIFLSNALQLYRAGDVLAAVRRYFPFIVCMMVGIPVFLWLSADASEEFLLTVLGTVVLIFVTLSFSPYVPRISDRHDRPAQIILGSSAGIIGGLTSIWLPSIVILLTARGAPKEEFIRGTSLLLLLGSFPLCWGYLQQGLLTGPIALLSAALLIPTMIGMSLGERLRARLSEQAFRNATLLLFFFVGLNLLRRGVLG